MMAEKRLLGGEMSQANTIEQQLTSGMQQQLSDWRAALQQGSTRLGWKVGFNRESDQQAAGIPSLQIGYLLKERSHLQQAEIRLKPTGKYLVEGEIAIRMAQSVAGNASPEQAEAAIGVYAAALELVNLKRNLGDNLQSLLACNLVHEAVILGDQTSKSLALTKLQATLQVNQPVVAELDASRVPPSFGPLICQVANILAENGEQLQAGDWIITGAATPPTTVVAGDTVSFQLATFAPLQIQFS